MGYARSNYVFSQKRSNHFVWIFSPLKYPASGGHLVCKMCILNRDLSNKFNNSLSYQTYLKSVHMSALKIRFWVDSTRFWSQSRKVFEHILILVGISSPTGFCQVPMRLRVLCSCSFRIILLKQKWSIYHFQDISVKLWASAFSFLKQKISNQKWN